MEDKNREEEIEIHRRSVSRRFLDKLEILTYSEFKAALENLEIFYNDKEQLGEGGYGVVYPGVWTTRFGEKERLIDVVIKQQFDSEKTMSKPDRVISDMEISLRMSHVNIARTFFAFGPLINDLQKKKFSSKQLTQGEDTMGIIMIMERYHGGDLVNWCWSLARLEKKFGGPTPRQPPALIKCVINQLLVALDYLHGLWIAHRDIAARNVMFDKHGTVKLIDLGLAKDLAHHKQSEDSEGAGKGHGPSTTTLAAADVYHGPQRGAIPTTSSDDERRNPPPPKGPAPIPVDKPRSPRPKSSSKDESSDSGPPQFFDVARVQPRPPPQESSDGIETIEVLKDSPPKQEPSKPQPRVQQSSDGIETIEVLQDSPPKPVHRPRMQQSSGGIETIEVLEDSPPKHVQEETNKKIAADMHRIQAEQKKWSDSLQAVTLTDTEKEQQIDPKDLPKWKPSKVGKSKRPLDWAVSALTWQEQQNELKRQQEEAEREQHGIEENIEPPVHGTQDAAGARQRSTHSRMMEEFGISDQARYQTGAPAANDDSKAPSMATLPDVELEHFAFDYKNAGKILLFMVSDQYNDKLTAYLWESQMAKFYTACHRAADRLQSTRRSQISTLIQHPWLTFDPLHSYVVENVTTVLM